MSWIKTTDRLPEPNTAVLVCCMETDDGPDPFVASGFWIKVPIGNDDPIVSWQSQDSFQGDLPIPWDVSHWMPLPRPPENV